MGSIQEKRAVVDGLYDGWKWKERVHKMSDLQIIAIYLRVMRDGPPKKNEPKPDKPKESDDDGLTLF